MLLLGATFTIDCCHLRVTACGCYAIFETAVLCYVESI